MKNSLMKKRLPLALAFFLAGCASMNTTLIPGHWEPVDSASPGLVVMDEDPDSVRVVLHNDEIIVLSELRVIENRLVGSEESILLEEINYLEVWVESEEKEKEEESLRVPWYLGLALLSVIANVLG